MMKTKIVSVDLDAVDIFPMAFSHGKEIDNQNIKVFARMPKNQSVLENELVEVEEFVVVSFSDPS